MKHRKAAESQRQRLCATGYSSRGSQGPRYRPKQKPALPLSLRSSPPFYELSMLTPSSKGKGRACALAIASCQFLTVMASELTAFLPVIPSSPAKMPR